MVGQDRRKVIISILSKHPEGLTIISVARLTGLNRHTATKYIYELIGAGIIQQRQVGPAKLCYLSKKFRDKKEREVFLKRLARKRFLSGTISQSKYLIIVLFAILVVVQSIVIAQNFTNFTNESNLTSFSTLGMNITLWNITNQTLPLNQSINETTPEISVNTTAPRVKPLLDVSVEAPKKITRGKTIEVKSIVRNVGSVLAKNVVINWRLPDNFEIVSGSLTENCGDLKVSSSCSSTVFVKTSLSTALGSNEVKVVVNYE